MKYLKLKPFKELQAAESGIESDYDKLDSIETCLAGVKRHVSNDNCIDIYFQHLIVCLISTGKYWTNFRCEKDKMN